jgi:hypothetical protein
LAGEEGQSLAVALWGARQGRWHDYSAGIGGDALDLVNGVLFHREDIKQAMDWARHWLGLPEQQRPLRTLRQPAIADEEAKSHREAMTIWLAAKPLTKGDLVDRYFRDRGISLERLAAANGGRLPRALRFHPGLYNGESRLHWPALSPRSPTSRAGNAPCIASGCKSATSPLRTGRWSARHRLRIPR